MWQEIFDDFKRLRASTPESKLSMSEENIIEDFIDFVDTRSPTLREADGGNRAALCCPGCGEIKVEERIYCTNCGTWLPRS